MPSPICRQQQLQSGFRVARTVGLFAHCPSSRAKGDVNGNQTGARKSAARRRRAGLGATRAAEASRGRLPFPRIFLSQSSSVTQDNFAQCTSVPQEKFAHCTSVPQDTFAHCTSVPQDNFAHCTSVPQENFAQCTSVPQDNFRSALPFPSKLGGGFAALLLP